jgi:hypothetical protein
MNLHKVIILNAILYIATFVVAAIILTLIGKPLQVSTPPNTDQIFVAMVTGIVLTVLGAWWYFQKAAASFKNGLLFGVIAVLVGFAMDAVLSIGIWISGKNPMSFLETSYTFFFFGIMLLLTVVLTGVVGWRKKKL